MCGHTHTYIYISCITCVYIYIYRERERQTMSANFQIHTRPASPGRDLYILFLSFWQDGASTGMSSLKPPAVKEQTIHCVRIALQFCSLSLSSDCASSLPSCVFLRQTRKQLVCVCRLSSQLSAWNRRVRVVKCLLSHAYF